MAYLRREKEIVEMDFSLVEVWAAITKAIVSLEWTAEETDETTHRVKARTKPSFMSYRSLIIVDAVAVGERTTRVSVTAETPTTTITGIVDFGRTRERIDLFLSALMRQLSPAKPEPKKTT